MGPNCGGKYGVLFPGSLGLSVKVMPTVVLSSASGSHCALPFQTWSSTFPVAQIQLNFEGRTTPLIEVTIPLVSTV